MTNALLDFACRESARKAAAGNQIVRFDWTEGTMPDMRFGDDVPLGPLAVIIDRGWDAWVAYPSGLVQPLPRVNWFWLFPNGSIRLGTAEQAWAYAQRLRLDPASVVAAPADRVHGTCVRNNQERLIQAGTFPSWAGV